MGWLWFILARWAERRGDRAVDRLLRMRKMQEKYFHRCGLDQYGRPPEARR